MRNAGHERHAALGLVRLHSLLAHESRERGLVGNERRGEVVPLARERGRRHAREHEVVHRAEEAQPEIPRCLVAEDRARRARILGEPAGQVAVDRRAEQREVLRLAAEDVPLIVAGRPAAAV